MEGDDDLPMMIPSLPSSSMSSRRSKACNGGGGRGSSSDHIIKSKKHRTMMTIREDDNTSTNNNSNNNNNNNNNNSNVNDKSAVKAFHNNDDIITIPPLPLRSATTKSSSSFLDTTNTTGHNKENNDIHQKFKKYHPILPNNTISPSMLKSSKTPSPPSSSSSSSSSIQTPMQTPTHPTPPNTIQRRLSRVLRSGETMEDFFCLNNKNNKNNSGHEYERIKSICNDIVAVGQYHGRGNSNMNDFSSNNIQKWKEVLLYVEKLHDYYENDNETSSSSSSSTGSNLIRLHKRATSRFGTNVYYCYNHHPTTTTTTITTTMNQANNTTNQNTEYEKDLVTIWLQYAKVLYKYNNKKSNNDNKQRRDNTISIFKLLQNKNLGQSMSEYYIAKAEFELETIMSSFQPCQKNLDVIDHTMDIIQSGIHNDAKPIELLHNFLEKLQRLKIKMLTNNVENKSGDGENKESKGTGESILIEKSTARLQKRHEDNLVTVTSINQESKSEMMQKSEAVASSSSSSSNSEMEKSVVAIGTSTSSSSSSSSLAASSYLNRSKKRTITSLRTKIKGNTNTPSIGMKKSKMGGPPKRISAIDDDEDDDDDEGDTSDINNQSKSDDSLISEFMNNKRPKVTFLEKEPEKITKASIGYLLNWNPGRIQESNQESKVSSDNGFDKGGESSINQSSRKNFQPSIDKIDESAKEHQSTGTGSQSSQNTNSTGSRDFTNTTMNQQTTETSALGKKDASHKQVDGRKVDESLNEIPKQILSGNNNPPVVHEFLPLISEKKMVKVNGVKYVKLSVIGKGGSCKVYRGLTTDGQNVAIKKVNLAGIQKKAILGYANEIKLLKRLSGNPAIIQLYDSEVSLEKKAIYLVMEIGETDLNHVLREQAIHNSNSKRSVNMNFIRLFWQQMLSAVHCIHEERIIHGDLKPANFLFVKGVLKLIDFGIAKAIQCDNTTNIYRDSQVGTLNYMSPESIQGTGGGQKLKCGRASDVWSLGCILYQMCYGKTPFADIPNMIAKLQAIIDPSHEIKFPETIPTSAIDAIRSCLKRIPEERSPIVGENGLLNQHRFLNHLD